MTEKRLISWEKWQDCCPWFEGDCEHDTCPNDDCDEDNCQEWAKLEIPPKLTNYSTNQLVVLANQLIHERDEITKRRAEVQESCEQWRLKCYELVKQIEILRKKPNPPVGKKPPPPPMSTPH